MTLALLGAFGILAGLLGPNHDEVVLGLIMVACGLTWAFIAAMARDWRINVEVTKKRR